MRQSTWVEKLAFSPTDGFEHRWNSAYLRKHGLFQVPARRREHRAHRVCWGKRPARGGLPGEVPHAGPGGRHRDGTNTSQVWAGEPPMAVWPGTASPRGDPWGCFPGKPTWFPLFRRHRNTAKIYGVLHSCLRNDYAPHRVVLAGVGWSMCTW